MVSFTSLAALLVAGATVASAAAPLFSINEQYKNNKVYRFNIDTVDQAKIVAAVLERYESQYSLDNWSHGVKGKVDIMIPDSAVAALKAELFDRVPSSIFIDDVKSHLDEELTYSSKNSFKLEAFLEANPEVAPTPSQFFSDYQSLDTHVAFLSSIPGITQSSIGKSFLGVDIPVFKVGNGPKSIVFSRRHPRTETNEWITPATTSYIANWLATDPVAAPLLQKFTFHIVPVLNVDGYAYTRSTSRLWRKNRQPNDGSTCIGTDPNRNWGYGWSLPGASGSKCSDTYYGPSAFSAPESKAISQYILSLGNVVSFIDFHSYSQLWMFANGYSCSVQIKDYTIVKAGGDKAVAALKSVYGTEFENGDICNTIYQASGSSVDWVYNVANVTFTYTAELRDTGAFGFQLPPAQIVPSGQETVAAVKALWEYVAEQVYGSDPTTTALPPAPTATAVPTTTTDIVSTTTTTNVPTTTTVVAPTTTTTTTIPSPTPTTTLCLHDKCQIGGPLTNACNDACVDRIISADAYCGAWAWDPTCVGQVSKVCGAKC
ncbi:hypothetical protein BC829DRAFT_435750 [Chytridium lagenaria]|nr:hypothetical protein BC829DRAFT_435750 [Chytridium lagenaria]